MRLRSPAAVLLLLAAGGVAPVECARADAALRPIRASKSEPSDGPEEIRERFRLYAERHADSGRIDPERRRRAVAEVYRLRREGSRPDGVRPLAVGGTRWVSLGPTNGAGRMTAVAPHPTRTGTVYAGAAGGGVWRTEDGGASWTPLTEDLADLSVGALAIAPSAPERIYLGTGEGGYASGFIPGIGLVTSNDGGASWAVAPTVLARAFYRISVHPERADELVAGTDAGGFRSTDGGRTWTSVIAGGVYGDVTDLVRSAADPRVLYAATWCAGPCSTGASRVLRSTDGGATWISKSVGLPVTVEDPFTERFSLAISPSDPRVLYVATALADAFGFDVVSHVYKSVDGGESWADLPGVAASPDFNVSRFMAFQSWYDNVIVVSPTNPDVVVAGGTDAIRSDDGGETWSLVPRSGFHVDLHDLRYQGSTLWIANDGGIWSSANDARTVSARNSGLVTRQYYALSNDLANRNRVLAGAQDNGTGQRTDAGGTVWRAALGADGFDCAVSPLAPNVIYATIQRGALFRSKDAGAETLGFSGITPPYEPDEARPFKTLLALAPGRPTTVYTASSRVWRSPDGGDTWVPLSTATADGSAWSEEAISALAVSPGDPSALLIGKSRTVYVTGDGGRTWRKAEGLPVATVNGLEFDPRNPRVAYAALATTSGEPLYRTSDGGAHWEAASGGLPHFAAHVARVDPTDSDILFCGTDVGVYRSTDRGATWTRFGTGLPAASVHDLRISEDATILRAATYGRGAWELEVPAPANRPPVAAVVAPGGAATVPRGATVLFSSRIEDADAGDPSTGIWTFPDTWETLETRGGDATVAHTFRRTGVFPVSLTARDTSGATASRFVTITVPESADACSAPIVLPGGGPFPSTVLVNSESATTQESDPAPECRPFAGSGTFASVWFELTPQASQLYEISTCGSSTDAMLSVFTGPACGPYEPVPGACNDDAPFDSACAAPASYVLLAAEAGRTYRIQLTGFFARDVATLPLTVRPAADAAPRVTGLNVNFGSARGGAGLILSGADFAPGATVLVGGVPAVDVEILGPTLATATTPPHAEGVADVVVKNPDGSSGRLLSAFTYLPAAGGPDAGPRATRTVPPRS